MDWKTAAAFYTARLEAALDVHRHAQHLVDLSQANAPQRVKEVLRRELEPTRNQLRRLKEGEFRIAVVGLEKAGKSTFINAWLEEDLLPAKSERCTFTATQVYSIRDDRRQELIIYPKTVDAFQRLHQELEEAAMKVTADSPVNAKRDLEALRKHAATLNEVLGKDPMPFPFLELQDIKAPLTQYVTDERYAHAVAEARLYTSRLAPADGIVFFDLPGLDSGLAKHVQDSKEMLANCDAVIIIQRDPTLRGPEIQLLQFVQLGDAYINLADKLFVFVTRIDQLATPAALQEYLQIIRDEWQKYAPRLPHDRIVPGAAGAYLVLSGKADPQTLQAVGVAKDVLETLKRVTGNADEESLRTKETGIPLIKDRVYRYLNSERVTVLAARCDALLNVIINAADELYAHVSVDHPENPEEAQRLEENRRRIAFSRWWEERWERIKAELNTYFDEQFGEVFSAQVSGSSIKQKSSIDAFRSRYLHLVDQEVQALWGSMSEQWEKFSKARADGGFDATRINYEWRERLFEKATEMLHNLAGELAVELKDELLKLVHKMTELLWNSGEVRPLLIRDVKIYVDDLERSLSVLFLRFSRPVMEVLIRGPVGSELRKNLIEKQGADIELLDNYYTGEEPAFKFLRKYANHGWRLLYDGSLRREVLGTTYSALTSLEVSEPPEKRVKDEVDADLDALGQYLRDAVYTAAGFKTFFIQEVENLRNKFMAWEATWRGLAENEWIAGNSLLLAELPPPLQSRIVDTVISDRLRQLSTALKNYRHSSFLGEESVDVVAS